MTKTEFLEKLRIELSSGVSPQVLQDNLAYYSQYIDDEIRKGRTEKEVLDELGDPWILAKTIVDAQGEEECVEDVIYDSDGQTYRGNSTSESEGSIHVWRLDSWWKKLLLVLAIVGIIVVIFAVISGIVSLIAPVLIPILIIMLLVRMLKRRW